MGTIRFTEGGDDGLYDHAGHVAQIWDDGTIHGGGLVEEVDRRTVALRAACSCGWLGETVLPRDPADPDGAWREWEQVPGLEAEWVAHTDPLLQELGREARKRRAGEPSAADLAGRIGDDVRALRDTLGGVSRLEAPQDVSHIVSSLADVPGRIANVLRECDRWLRRGIEDFAADDGDDPAAWVLDAVEAMEAAAGHLAEAAAPLHRAAADLSHLALTPEAADALEDRGAEQGESARAGLPPGVTPLPPRRRESDRRRQ